MARDRPRGRRGSRGLMLKARSASLASTGEPQEIGVVKHRGFCYIIQERLISVRVLVLFWNVGWGGAGGGPRG